MTVKMSMSPLKQLLIIHYQTPVSWVKAHTLGCVFY